MSTQFEKDILACLNKFRENPQSITNQVEILRKNLSRIKSSDPFLKEIDLFLTELKKMKSLPRLKLNPLLTKVASEESKKFALNPKYQLFKKGRELKGIVPDQYLTENPSLIADIGADDPENQIPKMLLNKNDEMKLGRAFLTDPKYTQIGIGMQIFEDEFYLIFIFANEDKANAPEPELPDEDMSELKQAFDLFDYDGNQMIKIQDALDAMKSMRFDVRNPDLYDIVKKMSEGKENVTWPQFASFVNERLTDRKTENGLRTIFDLFIDNPDKETITFDTFKRICRDIGETISEDEMKHVLKNATESGDQISFKDFCKYMKIVEPK